MKQEQVLYRLKIPKNLKDWVDEIAEDQRRSINQQIIYYLYQVKKMKKKEMLINESWFRE